MKPSTKDQIKGKALEVKGKVKETVGQVTNNPDLTTEGQADQLVGKFQKKLGQIEKVREKKVNRAAQTAWSDPDQWHSFRTGLR